MKIASTERFPHKPYFEKEPENVTALIETRVAFECTPISDLEPFMQWFFTEDPPEFANDTPIGRVIQVLPPTCCGCWRWWWFIRGVQGFIVYNFGFGGGIPTVEVCAEVLVPRSPQLGDGFGNFRALASPPNFDGSSEKYDSGDGRDGQYDVLVPVGPKSPHHLEVWTS